MPRFITYVRKVHQPVKLVLEIENFNKYLDFTIEIGKIVAKEHRSGEADTEFTWDPGLIA